MSCELKRIVIELRYPPILNFTEVAPKYLQSILLEYEGIDYKEGIKSSKLTSNDRSSELIVESLRAGISVEHIEDMTVLEVEVKRLVDFLKHSDVKKLIRLGVRTYHAMPVPELNFDQAVKKYLGHLLQADHLPLSENQLRDFMVVLEGEDKKEEISLKTGVMTKDEFKRKILSFRELDDEYDTWIIFDVDRFSTEIRPLPGQDKLIRYVKSNTKLVDNFIKQDDFLKHF